MKLRKRQWILGGVCAALMAGASCWPGAARAAGLLIADGGFGGVLEIKEHDVQVTINNGVAVTKVTQVFHNTEKRQVEALYTFPVPRTASVANFSMWINGKEMVGEVLEKKRAKEIYESYKQQRRDPGLLEQTDYRTFDMRVLPIGPDADQKCKSHITRNWITTTTRRLTSILWRRRRARVWMLARRRSSRSDSM